MYKMMLRKLILNEKVLAQSETYCNNHYNKSMFQKLWKESPRTLSLRGGPKFLLRIVPPDIDSETDNKVSRDIEDKQSEDGGSIAASKEHLMDPLAAEN